MQGLHTTNIYNILKLLMEAMLQAELSKTDMAQKNHHCQMTFIRKCVICIYIKYKFPLCKVKHVCIVVLYMFTAEKQLQSNL